MALEKETIARPYAQAAFELAGEEAEQWLQSLSALNIAYADPKVSSVLDDPTLSEDARTASALEGIETRPKGIDSFVRLLLENQRFSVIPEIVTLFQELQNRHKSVLRVVVTSAVDLSADNAKALEAKLATSHKEKLDITYEVDADVGGGLHLQIGDKVCDMTVRGSLMNLADQLTVSREVVA